VVERGARDMVFSAFRFVMAVALLTVGAAASMPALAQGCICNTETRAEIFADADVVFNGNPVAVTSYTEGEAKGDKTVFDVVQWIKGAKSDKKQAELYVLRSGCDVRFKVNSGPFTVAAFMDEKSRLTTNRCVMLNVHRDQ